MKYLIYLRVSTDQQAHSGLGIEAQRDICRQYISRLPTDSIIEFIDEGYSGSLELDKRPALLAAISNLQKGDLLIVAKRDRLGRDPIVNAMIERAVERKKAKLISASGDVREDNDASSILMRRMVDAFAEYERLIIGARTKAALQVKKKKNERVGHIPYGYQLAADKIHLETHPEEQKILAEIMQLRKEGLTLREIAQDLNALNIPSRSKRKWNHINIFNILSVRK